MLSKNTSLKRIDLRWNNLGISGGKALLEGLQRNGSMIELMLAGNKVSDETLRAVDHCLHKVWTEYGHLASKWTLRAKTCPLVLTW